MSNTLRTRLVRANHKMLKRILTLLEVLGKRELSVAAVARLLHWGPASIYRYLDIVRELGGRPRTRLVNGEVWYSMPSSRDVRVSLVRVVLEAVDDRLAHVLTPAA